MWSKYLLRLSKRHREEGNARLRRSAIATDWPLLGFLRLLLSLVMMGVILTIISFAPYARAESNDSSDGHDWMNSALGALAGLFSACQEIPQFTSFQDGSRTVNLSNGGEWASTGTTVQSGKLIKFSWNTYGLEKKPRKYLVLYRIDPRFNKPQTFVQEFDYKTGKYVSDFHTFNNGALIEYQKKQGVDLVSRIMNYLLFFDSKPAERILVNKDDVVNITLIDPGEFFAKGSDFAFELDSPSNEPEIIYTTSSALDNKLIYATSSVWCKAIKDVEVKSGMECEGGTYKNAWNPLANLVGKSDESKFTDILNKNGWSIITSVVDQSGESKFSKTQKVFLPCPEGSNSKDLSELCYYDKGRGMKISVGSKAIKDEITSFVHSNFNNRDFLYYKADANGFLTMNTSWQIKGMFRNVSQSMTEWLRFMTPERLNLYLNGEEVNLATNFLHFGRYAMLVEIGNSTDALRQQDLGKVKMEFIVSESTPAKSAQGTQFKQTDRIDAPSSGSLWVRVVNSDNNITGTVNVKYSSYVGNTWFSNVISNKVIAPLQKKFGELTRTFYTKLVTNATVQRMAKLMLTLYVIFYGLYFLAGATKLTVSDLVVRVVKISIIVALFSKTSWDFFNNNLFVFFVQGTDYLLTRVVDASSSATNVFGFVDPVFNKYTNPKIWSLLFIQLLQIHNGLAFLAIMTIYSILIYFRAVLEVVIGYVMAFLGLAVMVSLAPFFITLMLFERTKSIFNNWLSTLFNYMIQPTVLMIFFLLIDQLINAQILKTVLPACWGWLIPIEIGLDLTYIGIPLSFSFKLPFLPGIPFFVTQVPEISDAGEVIQNASSFLTVARTTLLFYAYCLMAYGLVEYVNMVIMQLTNVTPARKAGDIQRGGGATGSIMSDMKSLTSPITGSAKAVGGFIKEKTIDQKYRAKRDRISGKPPEYAEKIQERSRKNEDKS